MVHRLPTLKKIWVQGLKRELCFLHNRDDGYLWAELSLNSLHNYGLSTFYKTCLLPSLL
jgi:hypothetical protein